MQRRKLYQWRIGELEIGKRTARASRRDEQNHGGKRRYCIVERERGRTGAKIIAGWKALTKTAGSTVLRRKLVVRNRAVKWWETDEREAVRRVSRGAHARYMLKKIPQGVRSMLRIEQV